MEHFGRVPQWFDKEKVILPPINSKQKQHLNYDMPFEEYLKVPAISSSGIKRVLKSPQHYLSDLMGLSDNEENDAFRFGRAAHCLILEPKRFKELYVVEPVFSGLTKDGKESTRSSEAKAKREAWIKTLDPKAEIVTEEEMKILLYLTDSLVADPVIKNLLKNGNPEVSGFFEDEDTGLWCRFRPDYLSKDKEGRVYLIDLKTTHDSSEGLFSTGAARMGYDIQLAFYVDGLEKILGHAIESVGIVTLEKKPPYQTMLYWINEEDIATGRAWYKHALKILKKSMLENDWPGTAGSGTMLQMPRWRSEQSLPYFDFVKPL